MFRFSANDDDDYHDDEDEDDDNGEGDNYDDENDDENGDEAFWGMCRRACSICGPQQRGFGGDPDCDATLALVLAVLVLVLVRPTLVLFWSFCVFGSWWISFITSSLVFLFSLLHSTSIPGAAPRTICAVAFKAPYLPIVVKVSALTLPFPLSLLDNDSSTGFGCGTRCMTEVGALAVAAATAA